MLRLGQMDTKGLVRALGEEALLRYVSAHAGGRVWGGNVTFRDRSQHFHGPLFIGSLHK